jgi:hypothetical protein
MSAGANVCFALLDTAVIAGRADAPVVPGTSHARLLEDAAALAGVLRHLAVGPGARVVVRLPYDDEHHLPAVTAALAVARLGGVVLDDDDPEAMALLVGAASPVAARGRPRLVLGSDVEEPDLDWRVLLRAGRSDPAAAAVVPLASPYSRTRSVGEQVELLREGVAPWPAAELRDLLQV